MEEEEELHTHTHTHTHRERERDTSYVVFKPNLHSNPLKEPFGNNSPNEISTDGCLQ